MNRLLCYTIIILLLASCGGSSDSPTSPTSLNPVPNFTPSTSDLESQAINTFTENGFDVSVDPQWIDFNKTTEEIEQNDTVTESFTLTNNTNQSLTLKFETYSVSSGFALLDENDQPVDGWTEVSVDAGSTKTLQAKFTALILGTQTSAITITATGITGYIRLPLRASVAGAANMRVIPTGYLCSDADAPLVDELDFFKASYGQTLTRGIKICNTGGEIIKIYSAQIIEAESLNQSAAMESNAYEDLLWTVDDTIDSSFAFGTTPTTNGSFSAPVLTDSGLGVESPIANFSVAEYDSGHTIDDISLAAGSLLRLDVNFSPTLDAEAPEGALYNALPINATLAIETSLGNVHVPLLAATSGTEPILKMSYRLKDSDTWREVDLTSNGPAIYFGAVNIFRDWVANNSQTVEIKVENVGTGSKTLEFYGRSINGFFEYFWENDAALTFPLTMNAGESQTFNIRYLPSASDELDDDFEKQWNFGQFYFEHTGGSGPSGRVTLVGEQDLGDAVQLYLGGSELEREYDPDTYKNLCVISKNSAIPTTKTFTVKNNNKADALHVEWSVSDDTGSLSASPSSGSLDVEANASGDFSVDFLATTGNDGDPISGTLIVDTSFVETELDYTAITDSLTPRSFTVPFKATVSESGTNTLCGGGVLGDEDTMNVTFIMDRITMTMPPSLTEPLRNHPAFKFHWPLEVNRERGTVRVSQATNYNYDATSPDANPIKQIRSFTHQATAVSGCAPLPSNPYRLEFEKGSWTGEGFSCDTSDGEGTISFSKRQADGTSTTETFDSDMACLSNNGAETYSETDGTNYTVFYHDFVKFDDCVVQYYGKVATFAFQEGTDLFDVLEEAEASPNENEAFYEQVYGSFQHGSYIVFLEATSCGGVSKNAGDVIDDPDEIKTFYSCLTSDNSAKRAEGFLDECSYFNFTIDEGVEPADADAENPDTDSWSGFGTYEPYVDEDGNISSTKYDLTIYNAHFKALVISAGDREKFLGHPGHLIYINFYITVTTKTVANVDETDWQERIAVNARQHFDRNQVYLENGNPLILSGFWTEDGLNSELSNVIDETGLESGFDYGGFGKGTFRYLDDSRTSIVFAGWPVNYDENNLLVLVGLGAFTGQGNTAPNYIKADASTGKGKPLYFAFHGCLLAGTPDETQGCFDYHLDNATMPESDELVIDEYISTGVLPDGYATDCSTLADPGSENRYDMNYMACINYKILPQDRDRLTNYYSTGNRFEYEDNSYYNSTKCGYGM